MLSFALFDQETCPKKQSKSKQAGILEKALYFANMVRVFRRPASAFTGNASNGIAKRKAQRHKVVMESVTQEKKKLRSVISFETKAPPGYTFISAGNPQVTNACKERCRKEGLKILAVTTTPHMHTHNLSQHVHRIGIHFPSAVVAAVCMERGLYVTTTGKVVPIYGVGSNSGSDDAGVSQITINTEARDALKDLFPNIPDNDLNQIIKTAFQKGQRKVGTAIELPLARRAQLAVVAHIRHIYTDYDRLLKMTSFHEARTLVEEPTLAKVVEWRGDDENGKTVLEDVFREVIVISDDDDDSDSDEGENMPPFFNRDHSVEYVSSGARAVEIPVRPITYTDPNVQERSLRELSEDEAPPGFRVVPQEPKRNKIDRRGFSRYQAWDRALNRYRNLNHGADQRGIHGDSTNPQSVLYPLRQPLHRGLDSGTEARNQAVAPQLPLRAPPSHVSGDKTTALPLVVEDIHRKRLQQDGGRDILTFHEPYEVHPLPEHTRQGNPNIIQVSDAMSSKREPAFRDEQRPFRQYNSPDARVSVHAPQRVYDGNESQTRHQARVLASNNRTANAQERILPSIENSSLQETRRPESARLDGLPSRATGKPPIRSASPQHLSRQEGFRGIEDHFYDVPSPKRRQMAYYRPIHQDYPRSGVAPDTVGSVVPNVFNGASMGKQYMPCGFTPSGQTLTQDHSHLRRKNAAPVEPPLAGRRLQEVQSPYTQVFQANSNPNVSVDQRRIDDRAGHTSHQHHPEAYLGPPRQAYARLSAPNHVVAVDDSVARTALHPPSPRIRHVYDGRGYDMDNIRPLEVREPQVSVWQNQENEHFAPPQDDTQRRRIYADDFVRPIGVDEPEPLEYAIHRPRFQSQRVAGNFSHPSRVRVYNDSHRDTVADARTPITTHGHRRLAYHGVPQEQAIFDNTHRARHGSRVPASSFATRPYEQRHEGHVEFTQPAQGYRQYVPQDQNYLNHYSSHGNRINQPEPPYRKPDTRPVVIAD